MMATVTIHPDLEEMVITDKWTTLGEEKESPKHDNVTSNGDKKSFESPDEEISSADRNIDIVETSTGDPDSWDGKMDEEMVMTVTPEDNLEVRHLNEDNSESHEESLANGDCNGKQNKSDHYVLFDLAQYGFHFNVTPGWADIR